MFKVIDTRDMSTVYPSVSRAFAEMVERDNLHFVAYPAALNTDSINY